MVHIIKFSVVKVYKNRFDNYELPLKCSNIHDTHKHLIESIYYVYDYTRVYQYTTVDKQ